MNHLGLLLEQARKSRGLTQQQLRDRLEWCAKRSRSGRMGKYHRRQCELFADLLAKRSPSGMNLDGIGSPSMTCWSLKSTK